ncbi:MAG TPA: hypothetical protein PJ987_11400 [Bacteroidia bacterium]|nr:hypothetical protein [Bacteroidia bacterium]HMY43561.1 hypothetical protein [Chitinophagales bacterium]
MSKKTITIEVNAEFFKNMKKQKRAILVLMGSKLIPQAALNELQGTLNFFDHIQDIAVDELGFDENKVFTLPPNDNENSPEYKEYQKKYDDAVKRLDSKIIKNTQKK